MTASDDVFAPVVTPTGLAPLDKLLAGGLRPGLTVLGGTTGSGKTALATQIALGAAQNAAAHGLGPVVFDSLEMDRNELLIRMIIQMGGINEGYSPPLGFSAKDRPAAERSLEKLRGLPLFIEDRLASDIVPSLESLLAKIADEHPSWHRPSLLVIDPLGLIRVPDAVDAKVGMAMAVRDLHSMARRLGLPILLVSQLNRNASGRDPQLGDLPAASIEQDANCVLLIHRPMVDGRYGDHASLSLAKSRFGPVGSIWLPYLESQMILASAPDDV